MNLDLLRVDSDVAVNSGWVIVQLYFIQDVQQILWFYILHHIGNSTSPFLDWTVLNQCRRMPSELHAHQRLRGWTHHLGW
jgi:hypothetical protein